MLRPIRVLGPDDGEIQVVIAPGEACRPDAGADTHLSIAEAALLRDALNAAIDIHNRQCGLAAAKTRLDRLNCASGVLPPSLVRREAPEDGSVGERINARLNAARREPVASDGEA